MYGKSLQKTFLNHNFSGSQIVEYPELLKFIDELAPLVTKPEANKMEDVSKSVTDNTIGVHQELPQETLNTSTGNVLILANQQIETRLPSGKRRITPMLLKSVSSSEVIGNSLEVPTINDNSAFSSSSPTKSKIIVVQESSPKKLKMPGLDLQAQQMSIQW